MGKWGDTEGNADFAANSREPVLALGSSLVGRWQVITRTLRVPRKYPWNFQSYLRSSSAPSKRLGAEPEIDYFYTPSIMVSTY